MSSSSLNVIPLTLVHPILTMFSYNQWVAIVSTIHMYIYTYLLTYLLTYLPTKLVATKCLIYLSLPILQALTFGTYLAFVPTHLHR